ncbi:hypothetical protein [Aureliella helgolandensis]|uniref:Uncharacterized protein n=1 Tax=Aureliella helgolandensis TaxID=2527968 RepID=A0A518G111_9BACT|nr:hypothetical protein [Aureliella helgolandensis]QDV22283.1 hypothetical protein Q31a_05670 [Aureliella helgolandensis]
MDSADDTSGELDITSDPFPSQPPTPGGAGQRRLPSLRSQQGQSIANPSRRSKSVRAIFSCCHVYAHIAVPPKVVTGEIKIWRVHCPRCGRLVVIPNS